MNKERQKLHLISLGCAKNLVDSEILLGGLKHSKFDVIDEPDIQAYWKMTEGFGTTVYDYSGNGNHGTFVPVGTVNHVGTGDITTTLPTWSTNVPRV